MKPKLRDIAAHPIEHGGQTMVLLRDPLGLSDSTLAIPRPLAPILALMDGTRDELALESALRVRAGVRLAPGLLSQLILDLDAALLLDNERYRAASSAAISDYRSAPFRPMTLDGSSFPTDPVEAGASLQRYEDALTPVAPPHELRPIRGLVCPHIDYQRGGPVYAEVWRDAAEAAREAELVIVFGTDHQGSHGRLTLTRQSYATPWGVLPTDTDVVEVLAEAMGEDEAYAEELHHSGEHSIELAAVWLHFVRAGSSVPLLPILCGSFAEFVSGRGEPARHEPFAVATELLRGVMRTRRTLVVAAADLAHMGPAFGDPQGLDFVARARLRNADQGMLSVVCRGDAEAFFQILKSEGDRRHVCGLPPIYLTLRLLEGATGEPSGYDLCPADPYGTSIVSVAGVILR